MKTFLTERNFLILLSGVFINGVGGGVYAVSGMLLVLYLSGSVLYSGFAFFAITLANSIAFLVAPFTNYFTYKNGLIYCEVLKSALLFSIPLFYVTTGLHVYYVLILLFLIALLAQFTYPIESTIMPIIVGKDNIIKANSFLHTIREGMDIVFIAGAGILIAFTSPVLAIAITAFCHFLSSIMYLFFNFKQNEVAIERSTLRSFILSYVADLKEGIKHIQGSLIPKMIVSVTFINFGMGIMVPNLPAFSLIQGGSEATYGFYLAAMSLGVLIGAVLTPRVKGFRFGYLIIIIMAIAGGLWITAAMVSVVLSITLFGLGAVAAGIFNIMIFSSIQKQVEARLLGRVITVMTSIASVGMPIGALLGGIIGAAFGSAVPIFICGLALILFSFSWLAIHGLRDLPRIDDVVLFPVTQKDERVGV
ncbi:MFS general substrate transporter [Bacillus sp. JCM 19046]|nr:MFS general substrate transporter [Bacillus sp. JCM 19045]GAF17846.1 MFS general substrate transporter [Bacillus sp. JCM 19046]